MLLSDSKTSSRSASPPSRWKCVFIVAMKLASVTDGGHLVFDEKSFIVDLLKPHDLSSMMSL